MTRINPWVVVVYWEWILEFELECRLSWITEAARCIVWEKHLTYKKISLESTTRYLEDISAFSWLHVGANNKLSLIDTLLS